MKKSCKRLILTLIAAAAIGFPAIPAQAALSGPLPDQTAAARRVLEQYEGIADSDALSSLKQGLEEGSGDLAVLTEAAVTSAKSRELFNFQILSDVHMSVPALSTPDGFYGDTQGALKSALAYIQEHYPDSAQIVINGDTTINGLAAEHDYYLDAIRDCKIPVLTSMGNHEFYCVDTPADLDLRNETAIERYLAMANEYNRLKGLPEQEKVYFDRRVGGSHFIVLGSEGAPSLSQNITSGIISDRQLAWLEDKLIETEPDQPVFLFLHDPLNGTVFGSNDWGIGEEPSRAIKDILKKYPQVILSSGHMHNGLLGENAVYNDGFGTCIDLPAFQYVWNQSAVDIEDGVDVGYTVSVYPDRVLYTPVNFTDETVIRQYGITIDRASAEAASDLYDVRGRGETRSSEGGFVSDYGKTVTADGIRIRNLSAGGVGSFLVEVSRDGQTFQRVLESAFGAPAADSRPVPQAPAKSGWQKNFFPETLQFRYLRVTVTEGNDLNPEFEATMSPPERSELRELYLRARDMDISGLGAEEEAAYRTLLKQARGTLENPRSSQTSIELAQQNLLNWLEGEEEPTSSGCHSGVSHIVLLLPLLALGVLAVRRA